MFLNALCDLINSRSFQLSIRCDELASIGLRFNMYSGVLTLVEKGKIEKKAGKTIYFPWPALAFAFVLSTWVVEISLSLSAHLGEVRALFGYFHLSMRSECLLAWETRSTGATFEICQSNTPP